MPAKAPTPPLRHVGISLGNIERFVDGLGEFSQQLGTALAARAPALREQQGLALHFHVVPALVGCFGKDVGYLPVRRSQEWWHVQPQRLDLWHTLNQLNRYPAPRGTGWRLLTVHDLNFVHVKRGYSRWRDLRRLRRRLATHDRIVTISDHVGADLRQHLGEARPLQTVYNGVRDLSAAPQEAVPGMEPGYLFHISRMTGSKNVEALLAMMAAWPGQRLVLAGPSAVRNAELQARADALGLADVRILTMVNQAQKAWLYAHCGAFVFPSLTEGFGLPPVEALHFGKPVVMSDRTCLPEIGGDAAHYWHDFEPRAMRRVTEAALAAAGPAQAAAAKARARRFSWDRAADAYVAEYLRGAPHDGR
ncbi:Glycosyl transferase group 1 [Rubrivivax sp. A210]|nr:Glycosyl transferase group 1 [Rubrivivax sp. A210]